MLEWQEHIVRPPKCTDAPFCCSARDANTLFAPTTLLLLLHKPSSTLGVDEGLGRQVIRARCLQPGRTTTASSNVYFGCRTLLQQQQQYPSSSFCFAIVGVGHRQQRSICWLGFNYTTVSGFAQRNHCPDSSGLGNTRKQQNPQKTCRGS